MQIVSGSELFVCVLVSSDDVFSHFRSELNMLDSDDELFSKVCSEPLAPQAAQAGPTDAVGMAHVDLKFFKFCDNGEKQWSGTAMVVHNTPDALDNQQTF